MTTIELKSAYWTTHNQKYGVDHIFDKRKTENYELVYFMKGTDCAMELDELNYSLRGGDIVFRKPGQVNTSYMPYESIQLQFMIHDPNQKFLQNMKTLYRKKNSTEYEELFMNIYQTMMLKKPFGDICVESVLLKIIYKLLTDDEMTSKQSQGQQKSDMLNLLAYIDENFPNKLSVDEMGAAVGVSRRKVFQLFKEEIGQTPNRYINQVKLNYASEMLLHSDLSVEEIAYRSGFLNHHYFSTVFGKNRGMSPTKYRKIGCKTHKILRK